MLFEIDFDVILFAGGEIHHMEILVILFILFLSSCKKSIHRATSKMKKSSCQVSPSQLLNKRKSKEI